MPITPDQRAAVAAYCKTRNYSEDTAGRICSCLAGRGIDMDEVLDPKIDPDAIASKAPRATQSYHRNLRWAVGQIRDAMAVDLSGGDRPAGL